MIEDDNEEEKKKIMIRYTYLYVCLVEKECAI